MKRAMHHQAKSAEGWRDAIAWAASRLPVSVPRSRTAPVREGDSPELIAPRFGVELIPIPSGCRVPEGVPMISLTEAGHPRPLERTEDDDSDRLARWAITPVLTASSLKTLPSWLARQWLHTAASALVTGAGAAIVTAVSLALLIGDEDARMTVALTLAVLAGAAGWGYAAQVARCQTDRWVGVLEWQASAAVRSVVLRSPLSEKELSTDLGDQPAVAGRAFAAAVRLVSQPLATLGSILLAALVVVAIAAPTLVPVVIAMPLLGAALPAVLARRILRSYVESDTMVVRARDRLHRLLQNHATEGDYLADREATVESIRDASDAALAARTIGRRASWPITVTSGIMPLLPILVVLWAWPGQLPDDPGMAAMVIVALAGCGAACELVMDALVRALIIVTPAAAVRELVRSTPLGGISGFESGQSSSIDLVDRYERSKPPPPSQRPDPDQRRRDDHGCTSTGSQAQDP
jgi:hypothetical protein